MAETTSRRIQALLTKNGIGASSEGEDEDPLMRDTPWLAGLYAHSVRGRIASGPNIGRRNRTWGGSGESQEPEPSARRCANVDGFSVHANVSLPAHQRAKLENLCRYMLRPPLAVERLERLASGHLVYRMKTPWRDGTTHVTMSDSELLEKLSALVPAPRFHLVRYFGILASAAKQRPCIVPVPPPASGASLMKMLKCPVLKNVWRRKPVLLLISLQSTCGTHSEGRSIQITATGEMCN